MKNLSDDSWYKRILPSDTVSLAREFDELTKIPGQKKRTAQAMIPFFLLHKYGRCADVPTIDKVFTAWKRIKRV